jgi:ABC-type microcin C transport system permease subunit YejE
MALLTLSPINARRWRNFKANRRALWSLWVFSVLFVMSLFAEFLAYDKPILVNYRGQYYAPIWNFYPETEFGGDFQTEAVYRDPEVRCLIASGGLEDCFDDPEGIVSEIDAGTFAAEGFQEGWAIWPVIPYSFDTAVERPWRCALAAQWPELAWYGCNEARCDGSGDPRLPSFYPVYPDCDGSRLDHRGRSGGCAGVFWRLD